LALIQKKFQKFSRAPIFTCISQPQKAPMFRKVKAVITAPAVLGGVGSTIVTIPISRVSSFFSAVTTVITVVNELRVFNAIHSDKPFNNSAEPSSGVRALMVEKFKSPGFCPIAHSVCNIYAAIVALVELRFAVSLIMLVFSVAGAAVARIANFRYAPNHRIKSRVERKAEWFWEKLPHNIRIVLKDPGLLFCVGNVSLILIDLKFKELGGSGGAAIGFGLGCLLALIAIVRGIQPLLRSHAACASGSASVIGGISDLLLGYAAFYYGNAFTAIATIFWGLSNISLGARVGNTVFDRFWVMRWLRGEG